MGVDTVTGLCRSVHGFLHQFPHRPQRLIGPAVLQSRQQCLCTVSCSFRPVVLLFRSLGCCLGLPLFREGIQTFDRRLRDGVLGFGAVVARGRVHTHQELMDVRGVQCGDSLLQVGEQLPPHLGLDLQPALRVRDGGCQLGLDLPLNAGQVRDVAAHPGHNEDGLHPAGVGQLAQKHLRSSVRVRDLPDLAYCPPGDASGAAGTHNLLHCRRR